MANISVGANGLPKSTLGQAGVKLAGEKRGAVGLPKATLSYAGVKFTGESRGANGLPKTTGYAGARRTTRVGGQTAQASASAGVGVLPALRSSGAGSAASTSAGVGVKPAVRASGVGSAASNGVTAAVRKGIRAGLLSAAASAGAAGIRSFSKAGAGGSPGLVGFAGLRSLSKAGAVAAAASGSPSAGARLGSRVGANGVPAAASGGVGIRSALRAAGGAAAATVGKAGARLGAVLVGSKAAVASISTGLAVRVAARVGAYVAAAAASQGVPVRLALSPNNIRVAVSGATAAVTGFAGARLGYAVSKAFTNIAAKVRYGMGKAADHLGQPWALYRPLGPFDAINLPNALGPITVAVDSVPELTFVKSSKYTQKQWFAAFDATNIRVGDYFQAPDGVVWFVASLEPFKAPSVVRCNRVISVSAQPVRATFGQQSAYGGDIRGLEPAKLSGWPANCIETGRTRVGPANLPGDGHEGRYEITFPSYGSVVIQHNDRIADDAGNHFIVQAAEQTPLGWRVFADAVLA